ncbi:cryptococcal mannosyltransferase 1-domain-containing protein [Trichophaea hybrida]|nr:cryptococcal mannosyltransferase 1-domain-containing protein [Trichophaea hybrida]
MTAPNILAADSLPQPKAILPKFFSSLFTLSAYLGPQNIFLSIAENDSRDKTRAILYSYERELIRHNISYYLRTDDNLRSKNRGDNMDKPWLSVSDRMNYMAGVRNLALEPLYNSTVEWKRIIFFNDVIWDWRVVMALLQTEGEAVCTLDLDGSGLYDSWVLNDRCGDTVSTVWPYFWHPDDQRHIQRREPFEVGNCWNGIASLNAGPFLNTSTSVYNLDTPLRFLNSSEDCYQSECSSLPLKLFEITKSKGPRAVIVPDATVVYTKKWWLWYNVILRTKAVEWWIEAVERPWGWMWWPVLGKAMKWKGLDVEGEVECEIERWERCNRN